MSRVRFHWLKLVLLTLGVSLVGLFTHEFGHALSTICVGGKVAKVTFLPGIQIYPTLSKVDWDGTFGSVGWAFPQRMISRKEAGFIYLMGSGATALFALFSSFLVQIRSSRPWKPILLAVSALWPLDIISYSVFPQFGLPHWIILGGGQAEPVRGAVGMGLSPKIYFLGLGVFTVCNYFLLTISIKNKYEFENDLKDQ